jgi:hypothetical protein
MTGREVDTMQTITFGPGAPARCNRCDARSPLPKAVNAVRENSAAYRIQDFATLDCGHFDCHWVYVADIHYDTGMDQVGVNELR